MSGSTSLRSPAFAAVTPSVYSGSAWFLVKSTTPWISSSVMNAPCNLADLFAPIGRNSPSPMPISFSAPGWSRMTRESVSDDVANASREGTFVLIRPVTTSTDGRWVASTRWIPRRTGLLRDAHDRVLDVARGRHHQVGELVHDREDVRVRPVDALAAERCL